jgi:hypothetical protein
MANVVWAALKEHIFPTRGRNMDKQLRSFSSLTKKPTAFVPIAMSVVSLTLVLSTVLIFGVERQSDEGAVAHLWQLLMAGQVPIVAFFVIKWLPRAPRQALGVLAMHVGAGLASMAPVFFLHL